MSDDKPTGEERFDEEARIEAEEEALEQETPEAVGGGDYAPSVAARVSAFQRAGGSAKRYSSPPMGQGRTEKVVSGSSGRHFFGTITLRLSSMPWLNCPV